MDAVYIGIDVSKDRLDVHVSPSGEAFRGRTRRQRSGRPDRAAAYTLSDPGGGGSNRRVRDHRGGGSGGRAAAFGGDQPSPDRHFAQAVGKRAKSDPIDAAVIARFAEAVKPEPRPLPDQEARLLAELVARRRQIIETLVAERQREKRADNIRVRKSFTHGSSRCSRRSYPRSTATSTPWCAARPPAREGGPAGHLPGHQEYPRPHVPGRAARAWPPDPPRDRKPRRRCPIHPPVRTVERQKHGCWRQGARARGSLHGGALRCPLQSPDQSLLPTPARRR